MNVFLDSQGKHQKSTGYVGRVSPKSARYGKMN